MVVWSNFSELDFTPAIADADPDSLNGDEKLDSALLHDCTSRVRCNVSAKASSRDEPEHDADLVPVPLLMNRMC